MRKLFAIITALAFIAGNGYAYIPLSNSQNNLGSYQNAATQGMFYNELDIISAYPVELMDYTGSNLYTGWTNFRNYATSATTYPTPLSWSSNTGINTGAFQIGLTGDPLGMFGISDSRAGAIFQYWGSKLNADLDRNGTADDIDPYTGGTQSNSEFNYSQYTNYTDTDADGSVDWYELDTTDVEFYDNRTVKQWDAGVSKKGLFLDDLTAGFSISNQVDRTILNTGGTKSYTEIYATAAGVTANGRPSGSTYEYIYNANLAKNEEDQDSTYITDVLAQGRMPLQLLEGLVVDVGLGLRFQGNVNPNSLRKTAVTVDATDDNGLTVAGTQAFDTGISILDCTDANSVNYNTDFSGVHNNNTIWDANPASYGDNAGISDFSDSRTGSGPIVRLQAHVPFSKIDLTGVINYDTVKLDIDSSLTEKEYVYEAQAYNDGATDYTANWTELDYTKVTTGKGDNTISNLDLGLKIAFNQFELVKMAIGGFILVNTDNSEVKTAESSTSIITYDDGHATQNPFTVGNIPGPAAGGDPSVPTSDTFGTRSGDGEGTWSETKVVNGTTSTKITTTEFRVPIGVEIPVYKDKWLFRAGTQYSMTKTKTVTKTTTANSMTTLVETPAGGATTTTITVHPTNDAPNAIESTTYGETHTTLYTYGIQWNVSKELTVAANAVLDTNANPGTAPTDGKASLLDLDTYRNLSIQAVFHF